MISKRGIICLDGGGPLDIPAVDEGKDGNAEDGKQLDGLVGRAALDQSCISHQRRLSEPLSTYKSNCQGTKTTGDHKYLHSGKNGLSA